MWILINWLHLDLHCFQKRVYNFEKVCIIRSHAVLFSTLVNTHVPSTLEVVYNVITKQSINESVKNPRNMPDGLPSSLASLFGLWFYIQVNSFGHVETVS